MQGTLFNASEIFFTLALVINKEVIKAGVDF